MTLEYIPDQGFRLNDILFMWFESRSGTRTKLGQQHKQMDTITDLSEYFDGDESHNIHQYRDVYQDINSSKNYFFFNFDKEGRLTELELHWGIKIKVNSLELEFDRDLDSYIVSLTRMDAEIVELEEGNYLFKNLKISISNLSLIHI